MLLIVSDFACLSALEGPHVGSNLQLVFEGPAVGSKLQLVFEGPAVGSKLQLNEHTNVVHTIYCIQ